MARIYVKPQVRSRTAARPRTLDYSIIEQIANGIEKMVVQWNNAKESRVRPYSGRSSAQFPSPKQAAKIVSPEEAAPRPAQSGAPQVSREQEISSISNNLGATEMSIFVRKSAAFDEIIPNLIRSQMAKEQGINRSNDTDSSSSANSWFQTNSELHSLPKTGDPMLHAEDGGRDGSAGITPRLEAAVKNIENKFSSSVHEDVCEGGALESDDNSVQQTETESTDQEDEWGTGGTDLIRELAALSKQESFKEDKEALLDDYKVKVEELQIALLERSAEYEVKIVEMKMMMLDMKSKYRQQQLPSGSDKRSSEPSNHTFGGHQHEKQRIETLKKQMQKLKEDKDELGRELFCLKKKQRQSEKQKRNLDDALYKVSTLKRELAKRDEAILDSHLREKETKAHLNELHTELNNARAAQAEPGKLLALLPVLRNWLKTVKKEGQQHYPDFQEPKFPNNMENYPPYAYVHQRRRSQADAEIPLGATKDNGQRVDKIVGSVTKEIQALQKALEKLACGRYISEHQ